MKPHIALIVGALISACGRPNNAPPISKGVTDPAFDWERPLAASDHADRNWYKVLTFSSTKSLRDTVQWLTWAIEKHGHVQAQVETIDVRDVRFDRCTLHWFERRVSNDKGGVTTESRFAVNLADLNLLLTAPRASSDYITFGVTQASEVSRRYFEQGKEKGHARPERERSINLYVRNENHIGERIVWALVHAARLCGAKVKTDYGSSQ